MKISQVFVGLGGNLESPKQTILRALEAIQKLKGISYFLPSRLYETAPVSTQPQNWYVNAVCSFKTNMEPEELFDKLEMIEQNLGKAAKPKESPRIIDLDILFFGEEELKTTRLTIPHLCWKERLFVLAPLSDIAEEILVPENGRMKRMNIKNMVRFFPDNNQIVKVIP